MPPETPSRRRALAVLSPLNLRRLADGLMPWVARGWEFRPVPLEGSAGEILALIGSENPHGLIVEFEPDLVEGVFAFAKPTVVLFADLLIEGAVCINSDDYAMGRLAADYFLERGFIDFAFCGRPRAHAPERRSGFVDALREAGHAPAVFEEAEAARGGHPLWPPPGRRLLQWLDGQPRPCAVFAAHDALGRTLAEAAARLGRRVPDDLAILSASDDALICELADPPLSRIETPWEQIAAEAVSWVDHLTRGGHPPDDPVLIPPRGVTPRTSTEIIAAADPLVAAALRHARDHLQRLGSVDQWVRELGTNRRKLERLFRATLRESPQQALLRLRVARARERLRETDTSLARIAEECGFSRPEKLSLHVRRLTGETPSAIRRAARKVRQQKGPGG